MEASAAASTTMCRPTCELATQVTRSLRIARGDGVTDGDRYVFVRQTDEPADGRPTLEVAPCEEAALVAPRVARTTVTFADETTMAGHSRLAALATGPKERVAILNFASAKNPGGGFTTGASAQEESLARLGALAWVQWRAGTPLYTINRRDNKRCMYHSAVLYSPDVPFFKDESGKQCPTYPVDVITSAAPNASHARGRGASAADIEQTIVERVDLILASAAHHGATHLVLGAWGCGVFGNDAHVVAAAFRDALTTRFARVFHTVHFAVIGQPVNIFEELAATLSAH